MQTFNTNSDSSQEQLTTAFKSIAADVKVFMCIGTEKVLSDSLGPRVGQKLNENMESPIFVYGMEAANITAENLLYSYNFIKRLHPDCKIAVIDAGVGSKGQIGEIQVSRGGIVPGAATNKNLPEVGDVSVVGIVAERGLQDFYTTSYQKLQLIDKLAEFISKAVLDSISES